MISFISFVALSFGIVHAADVGTYDYTKSPNLSSATISQFNASANTTSPYKINSIIYDSPFNLTTTHPEYTITLAISEHPSQNTSSSDSVLTESLIFITPPADSGVGIGNDSAVRDWYSCAVVFKRVTDAANKRGENEDGGCFPTLGEPCIDALYAQVSDSTKSDGPVSCSNLITEIPTECKEAIEGTQDDLSGNVLSFDLNPSFNSSSSIPLLLTTSETHSPTNKSYYDESSHRIWPVLMYQKVTSGNPDFNQAASSTEVKCLRDQNAERSDSGTQTTLPTPSPSATDKPGAGMRLGIDKRGWGAVLVGLAAVVVMVG